MYFDAISYSLSQFKGFATLLQFYVENWRMEYESQLVAGPDTITNLLQFLLDERHKIVLL